MMTCRVVDPNLLIIIAWGAYNLTMTKFLLKKTDALKRCYQLHLPALKITALLFLANQIVELFLILLVGSEYSFGSEYSYVCFWDCNWYVDIVKNGYDLEAHQGWKGDAANWVFFPGFPLAAQAIRYLTQLAPWISVIITAKLFFFIAIFSFIEFCKAYNPSLPSILAGAVIAFSPYSIYANVGYTESLFLFLTCLFFILLHKKQFLGAGLVGGVLSSVKVLGVVTIVPYGIQALKQWQNLMVNRQYRPIVLLGGLIIPLGLVCFMFYLYWQVGDALAFSHAQRAWPRVFGNPLVYLEQGFRGDRYHKYLALTTILGALICIRLLLQKRIELASFTFLCILIPLTSSLLSMPRYIAWQAPALSVVAELIRKKHLWVIVLPCFIIGLAYMYLAWITRKGGFVI